MLAKKKQIKKAKRRKRRAGKERAAQISKSPWQCCSDGRSAAFVVIPKRIQIGKERREKEEQANQIFKSLWPHCSRQLTTGCHPFASSIVDVTVCFNRQIVSTFSLGFSRFPKHPFRLNGICLSLKYFSSINFPAFCLSVKSATNVPFTGLLMLPLLPYPWYTSF